MFNYREGLGKEDDHIPEKFFLNEFSYGEHKGAVVERTDFKQYMNKYYRERNWDTETSRLTNEVLKELGLGFTIS